MLRALILIVAVLLLALAALNVARVPDWLPWRLGVLANEYGHWLAFGPAILAIAAWWTRGSTIGPTLATWLVCAVALALLFRPAFTAARLARTLPSRLQTAFGQVALSHAPFSARELFVGDLPERATPATLSFSAELALDFYAARNSRPRPAPCVIVVHGGGWDSGDRGQMAPFNHWLSERGYAVAAVSYRLAPKFPWPAQREDLRAAIAFLKTRAGELNIDPSRLVLLGRSAGGQIAQTVAYTTEDAAIRGVIALYAPADLIFGYANTHENDALKSPALMRQYLGGPPETARANYENASAHYQVTRQSPPTLLLHGENDTLVWHRHSARLDARLAELRVPRAYVSLPWATHAFDYNLHGPGGQLTRFAVEWFLAAVTRAE